MLTTLLLFLLSLLILRITWEYLIRDHNIPPGPPRLPLIGNLHQAPTGNTLSHKVYDAWRQKYGPIFSLQLGGNTFIFISSPTITYDLLDRRANQYSDRPRLVFAGENLQKGNHIMLRQYDDALKLHRRMEGVVLTPRMTGCYAEVFELETGQMLVDLLEGGGGGGGEKFVECFERYTLSVMYGLTYGVRVPRFDCKDMRAVKRVGENLSKALEPGAWVVDALPWLNALPKGLAPWKRVAEEYFALESGVHLRHMDEALDEGRGWNWTREFMASEAGEGMARLEMAYDLGHLADAGFETQSMSLQVFTLACITQPAFLRRAHEELQTVIGDERLPNLTDKPNLPFINAIVKETLRWRTVVTTNFPHTTKVEDHYMGYRIPAGSNILALQWSMNLDPMAFPGPHDFNPERWLPPNNVDGKLKYHAFGYGRRICSGRHVAESSMFVAIARLLWAFDILPGEGASSIDVHDGFTPGFLTKPTPFDAVFRVKSQKVKRVIEKEWKCAEKDISVLLERIRVKRDGMKGE